MFAASTDTNVEYALVRLVSVLLEGDKLWTTHGCIHTRDACCPHAERGERKLAFVSQVKSRMTTTHDDHVVT